MDLTYEQSNGEWFCETNIDPNPRPRYDEAICSRIVPEKTEWETRHVAYQPLVITNAIGYKYEGQESKRSQWVFGGQINMDSAVSLTFAGASALLAFIAF